MKLISLNTWGGRYFDPLVDFIKLHSKDADIFCFQEIYGTKSDVKKYKNIRANLLEELIKILPDFQYLYSSEIKGFDSIPDPVNFDLAVGKAMFIKQNIKIDSKDDLLIFGDKSEKFLKKDFSNIPISFQYISFSVNNKMYIVCNIHGMSFPGSKLDTNIRLEHTKKLKDFLKTKIGAKIVTGDFNLLPETQSIKMLEENMRNLIKEFNIEKTRSNLSPFAGKPDFQKFADYTFVSEDINVESFQIPYVEISDHLPMILQFS